MLGLRRPLRLKKTRKLGPKPGTSANSCVQQPARFKNDVWTCDFIHDRTASGRPLKWLTLVDECYTRECLVLHADSSITGADVRRIVARVIGRRGADPHQERQWVGVHLRGVGELVTEQGSEVNPGGSG